MTLTAANPAAQQITKLLRVGRRLAVLGVEVNMEEGAAAPSMRHWHVVNPGSYNVPQLGTRLSIGRSMCGRRVATNGYASDHRPPDGSLCPACEERV